jgi:Fungal rhodopsin domain
MIRSVCLVSILRLQSLYVISISEDPTCKPPDLIRSLNSMLIWSLDDNVGASMWSNIEVYTGIICASLPAIKPIVAKLFPNLLSSTRSGTVKSTFHTFNDNGFGNNSGARPIRLADVELGQKTVTKVEANERGGYNLRESNSSGNLDKDIFITTSMRQDVESKFESRSQLGSEKDLIIQRP